MWLRGKALSSHALPPDRSLQNRDPTRGHATQEPCHRLLDRGPTSGSPAWADFAAPARIDFTAGTSAGCFRRAGKFPLILLLNSQRREAGYASKKIVVRLQAGNVEPCGQITPFMI